MSSQPRFHILSIDFQDLDVIWNVRLFYMAAGYSLIREWVDSELELLVILRGDPGLSHQGYDGAVHVYDYVKEIQVDWRSRFPQAREIRLISLFRPNSLPEGTRWVQGYLPVVPEFWQQRPFRKRAGRPLHIANFKPMGDDPYQQDLAHLARRGLVEVHGRHWDRIGLSTHGLSYLEANRLLAGAYCCYGLMYPYQRGTTLSGRMWQAPLHGCLVISEEGTNPLGLPGLLEVQRFAPDTLLSVASIRTCWQIQREATRYWHEATERLAHQLDLPVYLGPSASQLATCRRSRRAQHRQVVWGRRLHRLARWLTPPPISCWWRRRQRTLQGLGRILGAAARQGSGSTDR
ncbi:hypothetical protein [Synechococcus sp. CS-1332]|uniref:hypothetical protein n=1 Tax=Synechococcus sp. CS-1332 TaxID=2847972 RepID=UPI00223B4269|nr:hypothetical protein [Synechococcus sp. CS-1332]MCT0208503.1 hypothetical protein [Synechococcus sp. CS-1332]